MKTLVLASNNQKKIIELRALLPAQYWKVVTQGELGIDAAEETGLTFVENALLKARHASREANLPALADDSGIVVDAIAGAPGIFSARFAGANASDADNNEKLLAALAGVDDTLRSAHFHCSVVWLQHANDPDPLICQGRWHGSILHQPSGTHGFGYDPLFQPEGCSYSAAVMSAAEKAGLSHRGQAMRRLLAELRHLYPVAKEWPDAKSDPTE